MTVSEAQPLKVLEVENNKLKRLLAEAILDNAALKNVSYVERTGCAETSLLRQRR